MRRRNQCSLRTLAGMLAALAVAGCVTEGPQAHPTPIPLPRQPAGVRPDTLVLSADRVLVDSDRNGYYDTFSVYIFLFDSAYTPSIAVPGAFTFRLTDRSGSTLGTWNISPEQAAKAERRFPSGPGYLFTLSLLDVGTDRTQAMEGLLHCTFTPVRGDPIEPRSVVTLGIGPTR